jgi:hypothetical protein
LESEGTFWYKIAIITLHTNIKVNSKRMFKSNLYFLLALTKKGQKDKQLSKEKSAENKKTEWQEPHVKLGMNSDVH